MDHKSTASRTALSFTLSILFHVSLVAGGAVLGAFFVKNQSAPQAKGEQTFEVNYSEPQQTVAEAAPEVVEVAPAEIAEAPAAAPTQPPPPVAKKTPAKKAAPIAKAPVAPAKKIVVADFSETQVPAQAPIEVNESLNEPVAETSSDDMAAAAQAEESVVKSEDIKEDVSSEAATEVAEENAVAQPATETAEEVAEQKAEKKSEETSKPVATPAPAPVITEVAAGPAAKAEKAGSPTGDAKATSPTPAQADAPASKEAPQNFLTLKQAPGNRAPSYPNELRKQQVQGKGQLKYYVNKDGRIGQMELTQSTGSAELDKVALDAFAKYKFVPGQEGYTVHNFEFSLKGPAEAEPRRLRTTYNR